LSVSFTISHKDKDVLNIGSSSVSLDFIVTSLDTTSQASVSSLLRNSVDNVDERGLRNCEANDQSGAGSEHNQTHSNVLRSESVGSCNIDTELLDLSEGSGINRSRFIEDEHEVNLLVALLCRTVPSGVLSEGVSSRKSSYIGEFDRLSVSEDSTADFVLAINVHSLDSVAGRGSLGVCSATSSVNCSGRTSCIVAFSVVNGLWLIPCLSITCSTAVQVLQSSVKINDFSGSNTVVDSLDLSRVIIEELSRQSSSDIGIVGDNDVSLKLLRSLGNSHSNAQNHQKQVLHSEKIRQRTSPFFFCLLSY